MQFLDGNTKVPEALCTGSPRWGQKTNWGVVFFLLLHKKAGTSVVLHLLPPDGEKWGGNGGIKKKGVGLNG